MGEASEFAPFFEYEHESPKNRHNYEYINSLMARLSISNSTSLGGAEIANTANLRELGKLYQAAEILRVELSQKYGVEIPECSIRILSERELDEDFERTRNPMRRYQLVAFSNGTEIAFNPHAAFADRLKFLAHELGHCTLSSHGFYPEEYRADGRLGPKGVYEEKVAEVFQRDGEETLKANGFLGGRIASFVRRFDLSARIESTLGGKPLISQIMEENALGMKDIITRAEEILSIHAKLFSPRFYQEL